MKPVALLLALVLPLAGICAPAASADSLVQDGLAAEQRLDTPRALEAFLAADRAKPDDPFILQKIARQYSDSVVDLPTDAVDARKHRAELALGYAQRAVELNPNSAENVLSLAVCHGTLAIYSDTRTKIRLSRLVKEEAEQALAIDPNYDWAHHVLGRWHYEVSNLGVATPRLETS